MTARAVRNHNPGNIDRGAQWAGLLPYEQMTADQKAEKRFAVFSSDAYGFRALAVLLLNYRKLYGLKTVRQLIGRWAPPNENNTGGYVQRVCDGAGVTADQDLDLHDPAILAKLARAIATVECGGWLFTDDAVDQGVAMAEG